MKHRGGFCENTAVFGFDHCQCCWSKSTAPVLTATFNYSDTEIVSIWYRACHFPETFMWMQIPSSALLKCTAGLSLCSIRLITGHSGVSFSGHFCNFWQSYKTGVAWKRDLNLTIYPYAKYFHWTPWWQTQLWVHTLAGMQFSFIPTRQDAAQSPNIYIYFFAICDFLISNKHQ